MCTNDELKRVVNDRSGAKGEKFKLEDIFEPISKRNVYRNFFLNVLPHDECVKAFMKEREGNAMA